ncbi:MbtH family protein [Actinomadura sp. 9N215]|uniref:MbtH family protein n=1 Tax=Actinomadura sp. 9N215 TaxID=3375150 RepID=UPI00378E0287
MRTTSFDFENEDAVFKVLVNHEEQYSIWPADLPVPGGWEETGQQGPKSECDDYINRVWTDMRPKSLREWMDGQREEEEGKTGATGDAQEAADSAN